MSRRCADPGRRGGRGARPRRGRGDLRHRLPDLDGRPAASATRWSSGTSSSGTSWTWGRASRAWPPGIGWPSSRTGAAARATSAARAAGTSAWLGPRSGSTGTAASPSWRSSRSGRAGRRRRASPRTCSSSPSRSRSWRGQWAGRRRRPGETAAVVGRGTLGLLARPAPARARLPGPGRGAHGSAARPRARSGRRRHRRREQGRSVADAARRLAGARRRRSGRSRRREPPRRSSSSVGQVGFVRPGGRVVLTGLPHDPARVEFFWVVRREIDVRGSMIYREEFGEAVALLAAGRIRVEALLTHRFPLAAIDAALAAHRDPGVHQGRGLPRRLGRDELRAVVRTAASRIARAARGDPGEPPDRRAGERRTSRRSSRPGSRSSGTATATRSSRSPGSS